MCSLSSFCCGFEPLSVYKFNVEFSRIFFSRKSRYHVTVLLFIQKLAGATFPLFTLACGQGFHWFPVGMYEFWMAIRSGRTGGGMKKWLFSLMRRGGYRIEKRSGHLPALIKLLAVPLDTRLMHSHSFSFLLIDLSTGHEP